MKENALIKLLSQNDKGKGKSKRGDRRTDYATLSDMVYAETQGVDPTTEMLLESVKPAAFYIEMWNNGKRRAAKIKAKEDRAKAREEARLQKLKEKELAKIEKEKAKLAEKEQALTEAQTDNTETGE